MTLHTPVSLTLEVTKVTVIQTQGRGPDRILVETTMPEPYYPWAKQGMHFSIDAAQGTGENYVKDNWPHLIPVLKVIK